MHNYANHPQRYCIYIVWYIYVYIYVNKRSGSVARTANTLENELNR